MDKALAALKSLAASGGFLSQIKLGKVQFEIKSRAHQEQQNIHKGKKIMIGMNKCGDAAEKPLVFDAAAPENKKDPYLGIQPLS